MEDKEKQWLDLLNAFLAEGIVWSDELLIPIEHTINFVEQANARGFYVTAIDAWFPVHSKGELVGFAPALESFIDIGYFGNEHLTSEEASVLFEKFLSERVTHASFCFDLSFDWMDEI